MTAGVAQRHASFGNVPGTRRERNQSFDFRNNEAALNRRQSIKYHFPIVGLEDLDIDVSSISEDEIRRRVYGIPLKEMTFIAVESAVWRPTEASCRRSVIWSRERKLYESQRMQNLEEFKDRPYMQHRYPELKRHYPGTWKLATKEEIDNMVTRLTTIPAPTSASVAAQRRIKSAPPSFPILRKPIVRRPTTSLTI